MMLRLIDRESDQTDLCGQELPTCFVVIIIYHDPNGRKLVDQTIGKRVS